MLLVFSPKNSAFLARCAWATCCVCETGQTNVTLPPRQARLSSTHTQGDRGLMLGLLEGRGKRAITTTSHLRIKCATRARELAPVQQRVLYTRGRRQAANSAECRHGAMLRNENNDDAMGGGHPAKVAAHYPIPKAHAACKFYSPIHTGNQTTSPKRLTPRLAAKEGGLADG